MTTPTWPELIILMCFGETEETPFTGIVEVEDRYGFGAADGAAGDLDVDDMEVDLPQTVRVHKSGHRYRVETLDGEVLYIKGADRAWRFTPGADAPGMVDFVEGEEMEFGSYGYAVERPDPTRWRGNNFTRPAGPMRPTTYLGRDAWEIEIAPPPHKPVPITLVIDATTGMQLRWGSDRFGDVFRWIHVEHGVYLADDLFTWDGPAFLLYSDDYSGMSDDMREEFERADAERAAKAAALRLPDVRARVAGTMDVWGVEDDGSFHASIDFEAFVILDRRPHQDADWDDEHDDTDGRTRHEWSDGTWDWRLTVPPGIDDAEAAEIRRQLSEPRPDQP